MSSIEAGLRAKVERRARFVESLLRQSKEYFGESMPTTPPSEPPAKT
jgi:hypothetical protein